MIEQIINLRIVEFVNSNAGIWALLGLLFVILPLLIRYIYFFIEDKLSLLEKKLIRADENLALWDVDGDTCIRIGARVYHDNRHETRRYLKAYERLNEKGYIEPTGSQYRVSQKGKDRAKKLGASWLEWLVKL
jgi:hypothetical protein